MGRSFSRGSCLHNLTRILHFRRRILRNRDLGSRESVSSRRVRIVDGNRISRTGLDFIYLYGSGNSIKFGKKNSD